MAQESQEVGYVGLCRALIICVGAIKVTIGLIIIAVWVIMIAIGAILISIGPKMAPGWPKMASRWLKTVPRRFPRGPCFCSWKTTFHVFSTTSYKTKAASFRCSPSQVL